MSNSAKTVLWLGLFMIVAGIIRNWSLFSAVLFNTGAGSGAKVPPPGGIPVNPATHKCPPGYTFAFGRCFSPAVNPIAPPTGTI